MRPVRRVVPLVVWVVVSIVVLGGCTDLRTFRGAWHGPRVGDSPAVKVGVADDATALLTIDAIDSHGVRGTLNVSGLVAGAPFESLAGAEADALAQMTFDGDPLRVYLAFAPISDGGGAALAVIALYADHHVGLRLLRGGAAPLYAIFDLTEGA
jgi:hypothetical protein